MWKFRHQIINKAVSLIISTLFLVEHSVEPQLYLQQEYQSVFSCGTVSAVFQRVLLRQIYII